jgi:hypothetical protein
MIKNLNGLKGFSAWGVYNKVAFNLIFIREFNLDKYAFLENVARLTAEKDIVIIREELPLLAETAQRVHKTASYCLQEFKKGDRVARSKMLIEALTVTTLDDDEVMRLLAVHVDSNGMSYSKANIANLSAGEIFNLMILTMLECSDVDCDLSLMTENDKKVLDKHRVSIKEQAADILQHNADLPVEELIALGIKKALTIAG